MEKEKEANGPHREYYLFQFLNFHVFTFCFCFLVRIWARILICLNEGVINFDFDLILSHYYFLYCVYHIMYVT